MMRHRHWMSLALEAAREAGCAGEVPVGAVVVGPGEDLLAVGANRRERDADPTAHAEIVAMRSACARRRQWRLADCTLYVTLEPCAMCAGAILQARLGLLVYGADDPKAGAVTSVLNLPASGLSFHDLPVIAGVEEEACRLLLSDWFARERGDTVP
jgi:tRNA(adenine34) deaminase